jgi:uncharacterized protein YqeY
MIKEDIQKAILISLKGRKETELKVLRFILSEIKYAEINKQKDLTDEEVISLLQKEVKKRNESIDMFQKGGRQELVVDEQKQIKIIEEYLPKQMSNEELSKIVDKIFAITEDKTNMGKLIGMVMGRVKGKADGNKVALLVKDRMDKK